MVVHVKGVPLSQAILVAVVEDDESVREALSELLQVMGFASRKFANAEEFLAQYEHGMCDCLITDLRMPGMNGAELQQRIRALGSDLPVIVITSAPDAATRRRVLEGGAQAYLCKPIQDSVLLDHLWSALRNRTSESGRTDPLPNGG